MFLRACSATLFVLNRGVEGSTRHLFVPGEGGSLTRLLLLPPHFGMARRRNRRQQSKRYYFRYVLSSSLQGINPF